MTASLDKTKVTIASDGSNGLRIGVPSSAIVVSSTTLAPSGRGGFLLPAGFLSTRGSQIVDNTGNPVRIAAAAWQGTEGTAGAAFHGLWGTNYKVILDSVKADGFNCLRIGWSNVNLDVQPSNTPSQGTIDFAKNAELVGKTTRQIFQAVVAYCKVIGLKVIFDHHDNEGNGGQQPNGLWFDLGPGSNGTDGVVPGTVTNARFISDWVRFAQDYVGNDTVIGWDLDNEPLSAACQWDGSGSPTDIHKMFVDTGNALQAVHPGPLIICEAPITFGQGGVYGHDLRPVKTLPVVLNVPNKVVYSIHEYPNDIGGSPLPDNGPAHIADLMKLWGWLYTQDVAPVWVGELGGIFTKPDVVTWANTFFPFLNGQASGGPTFTGTQQPISTSYWSFGEEPSNPNGTQSAWGPGNYRPEVQTYTDQLLFKGYR